VLVLVIAIWVNQFLAVRIGAWRRRGGARALLAIGVTINLLGLGYYNTALSVAARRDLVVAVGLDALPAAPEIPFADWHSFFTFQAVSYLIRCLPAGNSCRRDAGEFAVYHSLFPQLVLGR